METSFFILATGVNIKVTSSQSIIVATAVLHNIACNIEEKIPRVSTEEETSINITDFNNVGDNIRRDTNNNSIRKKLLRYFQNIA